VKLLVAQGVSNYLTEELFILKKVSATKKVCVSEWVLGWLIGWFVSWLIGWLVCYLADD
jgi:hypothetical protein